MKNSMLSLGLVVLLFVVVLQIQMPLEVSVNAEDTTPKASEIEHGRYLVMHVAQCVQCHTPRDSKGKLLRERLLHGASIPVRGPGNQPAWAAESPWIAGLRNYEESFVLSLLQQGQRPDGTRPKHPMPTFEMTAADARAVVSYLKSLPH